MSLFTGYEERPPFCQAAPVWFDTVNEIADYYSQAGYETALRRGSWGMRLHIAHEVTDHHPGCDLTIELPYSAQDMKTEHRRQVLVYGHPPTLEDAEEFGRRWREQPDTQAAINWAVSTMPPALREKWEAAWRDMTKQ